MSVRTPNFGTSSVHAIAVSRIDPAPSSIRSEDAFLGENQADIDLIEKAKAGDPAAFVELCDRYRPHVWRAVNSVARGPDAEDLAQDAFVRAFSSLKRFRGEASFASWICRIALNAAHDHQKSAWRRRTVLAEPAEEGCDLSGSAEAEAMQRETARNVKLAVARLPEKLRTPIWLHYFEETSFAEIARLEGSSESTIRSRIKAGLARLGVWLAELGSFEEPPIRNGGAEDAATPFTHEEPPARESVRSCTAVPEVGLSR